MNDAENAPAEWKTIFCAILALVGILVGISLAFFRAWVWSSGEFGGEALGYAVSGVLIPGLIAYAVAGRKKVQSLNRFSLTFLLVTAILFAAEASNTHSTKKKPISDLVKEAAGTKAVDPTDSTETDRLTRDMLRDLFERRRLYDMQMAKLKDDLAQLYSVDSFSSRASMQRCVNAVRAMLALDQDFSRQIQGWRGYIKEDLDHSSLSASDKAGFMKGVDTSFGGSNILKLRDHILEEEAKWVAATTSLYTLAMANSSQIKVKGSQLLINDDKLRAHLNRELEVSKNLRNDVRSLNAQLTQLQREGMKKAGITREDLGLDRGHAPSQ